MSLEIVPEHIGPYRVLRPIAAGGMAEVYEVQDPSSGERFALKLLVAVKQALPRFDREYEAMTRLNHPGIVRVYHYGLHQNHPWLTMELLRGVPAQTHTKSVGRPGTPERTGEVLRIGYHVAQALRYIHDRGMIHRDLKSANVLVLPDGRVKLLDFGAALLLDAVERITTDGEFIGTFAYASPEQISGQRIDARSDLYSLGVLLFRLATGKRPFAHTTPDAMARAHLEEPPPKASELQPELPAELVHLIDQLLAKSPMERPQRAQEVAERLEAMAGRPFHDRSTLAIHVSASVAREAQRREVWDLVDQGPPSRWIALAGEEGSDRMRVLDRIRADAAERNLPSVFRAMRGGNTLGAVVSAFVALGMSGGPDSQKLARELDELSRSDQLVQPSLRGQVRRMAADVMRARTAGEHPVLLCLQELHRADVLALELLGGVLRALYADRAPVHVVASVRMAPLGRPGSELRRRLPDAHVVELPALTPREVAVAVGNMLGRRPPPAELARRLHRVTAGQPLYLEEAVHGMVTTGGIEADGSRLAWADQSMDVPIPDRARNVAERMLRELPVSWRRVLEAIAVAGEDSAAPLLARVLGLSSQELLPMLVALDHAGVLAFDPARARSRWRQPVLSLVVYDQILPCRLAVLQRALVAASRGLEPSPELVRAQISVDRFGHAVRDAVPLARNLIARHQFRTALSVLDALTERLDPNARGALVAEAHLLHSTCLRAVRPADPAAGKALARARKLAPSRDKPLQCRLLLGQGRLFGGIGHYRNAYKYTLQAWEAVPEGEHTLACDIALELAQSARLRGDLHEAESWYERAIEHAENTDDKPLRWIAAAGGSACILARGRLDDAEQALSRTMQEAERAEAHIAFTSALAAWTETLRHQGRYSEALGQLYRRLPAASQHQDPRLYVRLLLATAWLELDLSRLGRAQECTDTLAATIHRGELLHVRLEVQLLNGRILLASGQFRPAAYVLQDVAESAQKAELTVLRERARAVLAETLYALGDREAGRSMFQSSILGLMGSGEVTLLAESVRSRARVQAMETDPAELFRPVSSLLDEQPVALLKLEHLLARAAWHRSRDERNDARICHREAAMVLNRVATKLNDTDRAALRVHPWSNWIRRGLIRNSGARGPGNQGNRRG
jgi:serine/threonine protein kinase/tetratricopeptide (TPR) repeat protein